MSRVTFEVGEHVFIQAGHHRTDSSPDYIDATVVKVLKTRVVVEWSHTLRGEVVTSTKRFVIPTYGDRYQEEGYTNDYWHHVQLVKDDEELAVRRAAVDAQAERTRLNDTARSAARRLSESAWGQLPTDRVEDTIAALQALLDSRKAGE